MFDNVGPFRYDSSDDRKKVLCTGFKLNDITFINFNKSLISCASLKKYNFLDNTSLYEELAILEKWFKDVCVDGKDASMEMYSYKNNVIVKENFFYERHDVFDIWGEIDDTVLDKYAFTILNKIVETLEKDICIDNVLLNFDCWLVNRIIKFIKNESLDLCKGIKFFIPVKSTDGCVISILEI